MAAKTEALGIEIPRLETERVGVTIIGETPIILYRMSEKARHDLLLGAPPTSRGEKQQRAKHDPIKEFRAAPYTFSDPKEHTYLAVLAAAVKKAISSAALDMPGGIKKAQVGRLCWVEGEYLPIYGVPQLHMTTVRSADVNHTPDIRTRCILPTWCVDVVVSYVKPNLKKEGIINLLAAAGLTNGIGEWRPQKGSGTFGQFRIATAADEKEVASIKQDARAAQLAGMARALPYDDETASTLEWVMAEGKRRNFTLTAQEVA